MTSRIGFIGLGLMGRPMALRLLRAGYEVVLWNRTRDKALQVTEEGASVARSPADLAQQVDVVISIVTGPAEVEAVLQGPDGVLATLQPGKVLIEMSTIGAPMAVRVGEWCKKSGVDYLYAPVTGSVPGAENGLLTVMAGGDAAVFERYRDILQVFGEPLRIGDVAATAAVKLGQNMIAAAIAQALAEAMRLVQSYDVAREQFFQVLLKTGVSSPFLRLKGEKMVQGDYRPQFSTDNMRKDLALISAESAQTGRLPLVEQLLETYTAVCATGQGSVDYAVLAEQFAEQPVTQKRKTR